jgi:hypothetical protein
MYCKETIARFVRALLFGACYESDNCKETFGYCDAKVTRRATRQESTRRTRASALQNTHYVMGGRKPMGKSTGTWCLGGLNGYCKAYKGIVSDCKVAL